MIRSTVTALSAGHPTAKYTLAPDVVLALLDDGSGRLLDLAGRFHALSASAATMLSAALRVGETAAAEEIAAHFRVDASVIRDDLRRFLKGLESQNLIGRAGRTRKPSQGRLAWCFFGPVLRIANLLSPLSRAKAGVLLGAAHCSVRWFGWANTLAAWQRCLGAVPPRLSPDEVLAAKAADEALGAAAARHLLHVECKERALACWSMLRSCGLPARLVVGVDPFPFAAHCWCELGPLVLTDFPDRCERFTPVACYA